MTQIKLCPSCNSQNLPHVLDCTCGASLDGVDPVFTLEPATCPSSSEGVVSLTVTDLPATTIGLVGSWKCPNIDCEAMVPPGNELCPLCWTPMPTASNSTNPPIIEITWPWGREPLSEALIVGRQEPTPPALIQKLELSYGKVSRRHASLEPRDGHLLVCDLGSSNGTFLNGIKLLPNQETPVNDRDRIRFASQLEILIHYGTQ